VNTYTYLQAIFFLFIPKNLFFFSISFLISSCSPTINFLGDSFPPTTDIDVFYDEIDVKLEYKTIGQMNHNSTSMIDVDEIKRSMIAKAKEKGGDGIIFYMDVLTNRDSD